MTETRNVAKIIADMIEQDIGYWLLNVKHPNTIIVTSRKVANIIDKLGVRPNATSWILTAVLVELQNRGWRVVEKINHKRRVTYILTKNQGDGHE